MFIPSLKLWNTSLFCLPLLSSFLRLVNTSCQSRFLFWESTKWSFAFEPTLGLAGSLRGNPDQAIDARRRSRGRHQRLTSIPRPPSTPFADPEAAIDARRWSPRPPLTPGANPSCHRHPTLLSQLSSSVLLAADPEFFYRSADAVTTGPRWPAIANTTHHVTVITVVSQMLSAVYSSHRCVLWAFHYSRLVVVFFTFLCKKYFETCLRSFALRPVLGHLLWDLS